MPTISMFYGITIHMQSERGGKHHGPHIHVRYQDDELVIGLDGQVYGGELPAKQMKLLLAWMAIHEDELNANWRLLSEGEAAFRIEPLR
ncbi:MAG: DUF4160 domain-containing protein [Clostridia bacterium]|nr:DUF4160 domain-containing protein [Clostridia bacterium]